MSKCIFSNTGYALGNRDMFEALTTFKSLVSNPGYGVGIFLTNDAWRNNDMCDIFIVVFAGSYFYCGIASDIVVLDIQEFACYHTIFLVYRHKSNNRQR